MRVALTLLLLNVGQPANAGWTFCVAESDGGKQIWITGVFYAAQDRLRLEADFRSILRKHRVSDSVVQCPAPNQDKTEVVNSQFTAVNFHRKLGDIVHWVETPGFWSRR